MNLVNVRNSFVFDHKTFIMLHICFIYFKKKIHIFLSCTSSATFNESEGLINFKQKINHIIKSTPLKTRIMSRSNNMRIFFDF